MSQFPYVNQQEAQVSFYRAFFGGNEPAVYGQQALQLPAANGLVQNGLIVARDIATRSLFTPFSASEIKVAQGTTTGTSLTVATGSASPTAGQFVFGPGIASGTKVTAVASGVATLSTAVLYATSGDFEFTAYELYGIMDDQWLNLNSVNPGSANTYGVSDGGANSKITSLNVPLSLLAAGDSVTGPNVISGTTITSVTSNGIVLSSSVPAGNVSLTISLAGVTGGFFNIALVDANSSLWYYNRLFGASGLNTTAEVDYLIANGNAFVDNRWNGQTQIKVISFKSSMKV